jgi:ribosome-associated translation inhibitor RaiA
MQTPLQVTFHNVDHSPALETRIRAAAAKLEQFYDRVVGCRVVVEAPHRHHHKGNLYRVRMYITVPGGEIDVSRNPEENHAHEDPYVAIRDAFKAARRRLEDYARQRRGVAKTHETAAGRATATPLKLRSRSSTQKSRVAVASGDQPADRHKWIAEAAYFKAERRGFSPGHDWQDWFEAEGELDAVVKVPVLRFR